MCQEASGPMTELKEQKKWKAVLTRGRGGLYYSTTWMLIGPWSSPVTPEVKEWGDTCAGYHVFDTEELATKWAIKHEKISPWEFQTEVIPVMVRGKAIPFIDADGSGYAVEQWKPYKKEDDED